MFKKPNNEKFKLDNNSFNILNFDIVNMNITLYIDKLELNYFIKVDIYFIEIYAVYELKTLGHLSV